MDNLSLKDLDTVLNNIVSTFEIVYCEFTSAQFIPYWSRKIGAVTRLDEKTIYIHHHLSQKEEQLTFLHEALSIYYYQNNILRHDEEIEKETKRIYNHPGTSSLIAKYIRKCKKKGRRDK